jgi:cell division protein FtsZ
MEEEKPIVFEFEIHQPELPVTDQIVAHVEAEQPTEEIIQEIKEEILEKTTGFLVKPAVIYAEEIQELEPQETMEVVSIQPIAEAVSPVIEITEEPSMEEKPTAEIKLQTEESVTDEEEEEMMQIVYHESPAIEVRSETIAEEPVIPTAATIDSPMAAFDEAEAQKLRAAERLYKLRNLSFNFNAADPNNEYDSIPAYVRHNLQVHNTTLASVEKFYSSYSVGTDDQNNTQISTINTFLEGKKPD